MPKKKLSLEEFARMGGYALARKRTQAQRQDAARKAAVARWRKVRQVKTA